MPKIDMPIKRLVQRRPGDWVKYLNPEQRLAGLYPLLPLMKGEAGEDPRQVLQQSIEAVKEVEDKSLQQDLLAVMGILAGGRYAAELVYSMIRREMILESPIYQEWVKEERAEAEAKGRAEGRAEGKVEKAQDAICKYLKRRFGPASEELQRVVRGVTSLEALDGVMEELFAANTIEEAQGIIRDGIERFVQ